MKVEDLSKYQPAVVDLLKRAREKNRLSHAYLFEGESGCGTKEAAQYFAMMLLCEEENSPCLKCNTCERIMYNSHMSVVMIEPINNMISKDQIEALIHDFNYTMIEGSANVYIIKDADKMNTYATNALLKMMEEPAANHYVVLTTTNHKKILDTIVSRCQYVHFNAPASSLVYEHLLSKGLNHEMAQAISYLTLDFDEAMEYSQNEIFKQIFDFAVKITSYKYSKKDTFVEYYLNKEFILSLDNNWHYVFFDLLTILNKELYSVLSGGITSDFEFIKSININNLDKQNILDNIEIINKYESRISAHVNLDLTYCSLFCEY